MTTFIKNNLIIITLLLTLLGTAFAVTNHVFAFGESGDGGCCGGEGEGGDYGFSSPSEPDGGEPLPVPDPICEFIRFDGQAGTVDVPAGTTNGNLSWSTQNAVDARLNGNNVTLSTSNYSVNFTGDTTWNLVVTNSAGTQTTCAVSVVEADPIPLPECVLNANPSSITRGHSSSLIWTTTNAVTAEIDQNINSVAVGTNRSRTITPDTTTTYTMTVANSAGDEATCETTVKVTAPASPLPICTLTLGKTTITRGESTQLTWTTQYAVSAKFVPGDVAVQPTDGNVGLTISPNASRTYTMVVTNSDGDTADCDVDITVNDPPATPLPECVISANPNEVEKGKSSVLVWTTTNAVTAVIDQNINSVAVGTNRARTITPDTTTTYTMTVANSDGDEAECSTTVKVTTPSTPTPFSCDDVTFRADRTSLPRGGGDVKFTWDALEADSASIPRLNTTALEGEKTIRLTRTETISLNVTKGSVSDTCPIRVTVATGGGGGGSVTPRCELEISDRTITRGQQVTLTWDSSRAQDIEITDNHGNTIVTTHDKLARDKADFFDGSIKLRPTKDTTYTMIAERGSRDRECEVSVKVGGGIVVQETRSQEPIVAGIALTQVPYTGFEAGPMLTFLFYTLLVIWGLFVAYVFVIRRSQFGGISFANSHGGGPVTDVTTDATSNRNESVAEAYVAQATATAPAPQNLPTADAAATPVVGYASQAAPSAATIAADASDTSALTELENRAHAQKALFSSDAMRFLVAATTATTRDAELDRVIHLAKERYPSENGWVVINHERIEALSSTPDATPKEDVQTEVAVDVTPTPTTAGSLAEAIATQNVTAAYQMIAHRPMIALADAATEFDGVIRSRNGAANGVSEMLAAATKQVSEANIREAIHALTSALDGVYTNEEEAVKMAILKAVKALN